MIFVVGGASHAIIAGSGGKGAVATALVEIRGRTAVADELSGSFEYLEICVSSSLAS